MMEEMGQAGLCLKALLAETGLEFSTQGPS